MVPSFTNKIQGKNIYFIKATSKDCYNYLANLYPCRGYYEMKNYHFICLHSSNDFEVSILYDINAQKKYEVIPQKQLFEDKWEESNFKVETYKWKPKEKVDFYVKHVCIIDENGKDIDKHTYKNPVIEEGRYKDFYLKPFKLVLKDSRPAFEYRHDRKNITLERKTIINIIGSKDEKISREIILKGMQKEVEIELEHSYSENEVELSTNIDFDKTIINNVKCINEPQLIGDNVILT